MRTMLALLALPILAVCSPSEERTTEEGQLSDTPEAPGVASEESLSSWTAHVADGDAAGFQIVIEGEDLAIVTAAEGHAWRPTDMVLGGDFQVSAVFEPRDEATSRDDEYGIMVGGKNLPDADRAYTVFLVRPSGEHKIARHEAGATNTLIDWKSGPGPTGAQAGETPSTSHQLEIHVAGENVEFLVGGALVATLARPDVQPHGLAGVHVGPNANVKVGGFGVRGEQVGDGATPGDSLPSARP